MKIEGMRKIDVPRDRVFVALIDPAVLQKCIPGCEQMEKTGDNAYNAKLTAGVGSIKGIFTATVSVENIKAPESYTLVVEGKGQKGFVKGTGELSLTEVDDGTSIHYEGEVSVGGLLASVGQRMIKGAANMMAKKFLRRIERQTKGLEVEAETLEAEAEALEAEASEGEAETVNGKVDALDGETKSHDES